MALDPAPRRELHWSPKEKSLARAAFDSALAHENASIRKEVERMLQGTKRMPYGMYSSSSQAGSGISSKSTITATRCSSAYSPGYFMKAGCLNRTLPGSVPRSLSSSDAALEQRGNSMPNMASVLARREPACFSKDAPCLGKRDAPGHPARLSPAKLAADGQPYYFLVALHFPSTPFSSRKVPSMRPAVTRPAKSRRRPAGST